MLDEEIRVAADWWTNVLRQRPLLNSGDPLASGLGMMLAESRWAPLTEEQLGQFRTALVTRLRDLARRRVETFGGEPVFLFVNVDYGPDLVLTQAAEEAGFGTALRFPWKTRMCISPGRVAVACGYRAPDRVIYDAEAREQQMEESMIQELGLEGPGAEE